ncbi:hypothetical protein GE061_006778 [Apolygus lucorum]|uniref:Major facilitator superfamily (MFS) profile domain-containing protein n=1 Tax=Apolygus lucorum TaxID=248454 RepID=A0A8S9WSF4_APOLU|nr:hypothetical protein GE061_006778 [Apolygus lucorum]
MIPVLLMKGTNLQKSALPRKHLRRKSILVIIHEVDTLPAPDLSEESDYDWWLATLLGLLIIGACLMCIPLATNMYDLIVPNAGLGFAIGMVDSSMMPHLAYLVDIRHTAVYGTVYAIGDVAFCLGYCIGPAVSGTLVNTIGFEWMLVLIAFLNFGYAPLMFMLRHPPTKEEEEVYKANRIPEHEYFRSKYLAAGVFHKC